MKIMNRLRPVIVVIALIVASVFWIRTSLGTCETLDRWLGRSACVAKYTIQDMRPLGFATMVQAPDNTLRIFGYNGEKSPLVATQIAFDLTTGVEKDRKPLPFAQMAYRAIPALAGDRVAVICLSSDICDRQRPQGYILSSQDGAVLAEVPVADALSWTFPDEERISVRLDAAVLADSHVAAYPDPGTGGIILRKFPGAVETERLVPESARQVPAVATAFAVKASLSGRYIAVINSATGDHDIGTRLDVWDVGAKKMINQIITDSGHRLDTNAIWSRDERHMIAFRSFTDSDPDEGAALYVLKVRD
ncbi:hypothetical protein SAMN02982989_1018 [Xaviernesmea oryzae]|uniref:Uncharacterized protein n=1 Tax=Xaviernesmea oryzae TaxID=464029 RepID=A0A1X7FWM6_9HYPH|nr:hypothetical protein [Xaviernesmea oryzae]SMF60069.1 hypothetical protein SAMN02982989_1018 [Xaviernesmea oryzae]